MDTSTVWADEEVDFQSGMYVVSASMIATFKQLGAEPGTPQDILLFNNSADLLTRHTAHLENGEQDPAATAALAGFIQRALMPNDQAVEPPSKASGFDRSQYQNAARILEDRRAFLKDYLELLHEAGLLVQATTTEEGDQKPGDPLAHWLDTQWHVKQLRDHAVVWQSPPKDSTAASNPHAPAGQPANLAAAVKTALPHHRFELRRVDGKWKVSKLMALTPSMQPAVRPNGALGVE